MAAFDGKAKAIAYGVTGPRAELIDRFARSSYEEAPYESERDGSLVNLLS